MSQLNPYEPPQHANEPLKSGAHVRMTPGGYVAAIMVVFAAALAMSATIPGRTQGLALITQRLIEEIPGVTKDSFAWINCWGTLLGGLFCLPCGWLLDRIAPKYFALVTIAALGAVTIAMSQAHDATSLMVYVTLARGLGQSMLSVISLTLMAKWFRRDSAAPMAGYAVAMTMLMVVGFGMLQSGLSAKAEDAPLPDWRPVWKGLGWTLVCLSPLCAFLAWPVTPGRKPEDAAAVPFASATVWDAFATSSFWVFALSISLFGLVSSGVSLFQEEIFKTLRLDVRVFYACQLIGLGVGLLSNFFTGWLARKVPLSLLLGLAMAVFAASLFKLPLLRTPGLAYLQAVVHAFAGGAIVVLFYLIWVHSFGPKHVGEIQGAVQFLTVIASAIGPPVIIMGSTLFGGYAGIIWLLAILAAVLAAMAFAIRVPVAARGDWSHLRAAPSTDFQFSQENA